MAGGVVECCVWREDEWISNFETGEIASLPDGVAGWISVPVVVGFCDVANVIEFLSRVVCVYIFACTIEIVTAVLDTPEPTELSAWVEDEI